MGTVQESPFVSEEEVRYLVREGARKGIFEKVEEEMVHNVFEFADTIVREIMTPRLHIKGLDIGTRPEETLGKTLETGHSRIPVYDGSPETTLGLVTLRDLLAAISRGDRLCSRLSCGRPCSSPRLRGSATCCASSRTVDTGSPWSWMSMVASSAW